MAVKGADRPFDLVLAGRADDFVREVEEGVEPEALAVPHPDAAVFEGVAEMLEDIVRRLAGLAPCTRARTRSKRGSWNTCIPVYV